MILIELLPNRWKVGHLSLQDDQGQRILGPLAALGRSDDAAARAHDNPSRDPLKAFGDTPLGTYSCHLESSQQPPHSYGPGECIGLTPTGGDALIAAKNGRSGLLIHGGDPGPDNTMRPTHGCIRMFNADIKLLTDMLDSNPALGSTCIVRYSVAGTAPAESLLLRSSAEQLSQETYPATEGVAFVQAPANNTFSIDTNLVATASPLSTKLIAAFFQAQPDPHKSLQDIADPVMEASKQYQVNASYIVAHAIWESGWGTSTISRVKNNLFGYTAYDASPEESATSFASRAACIQYVIPRIKKNYLTPNGTYFVRKACLGDMTYGMNVHYASDSTWGAGIASVARMIEKFVKANS